MISIYKYIDTTLDRGNPDSVITEYTHLHWYQQLRIQSLEKGDANSAPQRKTSEALVARHP